MKEHADYWAGLMEQGKVHVYGPVMDPEGMFGVGVFSAENEQEVQELMAHDPAARIMMTYRVCPMRAFLPSYLSAIR